MHLRNIYLLNCFLDLLWNFEDFKNVFFCFVYNLIEPEIQPLKTLNIWLGTGPPAKPQCCTVRSRVVQGQELHECVGPEEPAGGIPRGAGPAHALLGLHVLSLTFLGVQYIWQDPLQNQ